MDFFGIGLLEMGLILLVALIVVGPTRLPEMAQKMGFYLQQARRQMAEAKQTLMAEVEPIKEAADLARNPTEPLEEAPDAAPPAPDNDKGAPPASSA